MDNLTISVRYAPRSASERCDLPGVTVDTIPWAGVLTVDGHVVGTLRGGSATYILEILSKAAEKHHA